VVWRQRDDVQNLLLASFPSYMDRRQKKPPISFSCLLLFLLSPCQLFPLSLMSSNIGLHHPAMDHRTGLFPLNFNSHALLSIPILPILFTWPNHCDHYEVMKLTVFQDDSIHSDTQSPIFWRNLLPPSSGWKSKPSVGKSGTDVGTGRTRPRLYIIFIAPWWEPQISKLDVVRPQKVRWGNSLPANDYTVMWHLNAGSVLSEKHRRNVHC
jgi:hypothetical protein